MFRILPVLFLTVLCMTAGMEQATAAPAAPLPRVVYGFDREFPPFSFEEAEGKRTGFDVEIVDAVFAGRANLVPRPLQWEMVPLELSSGSIHVTSGMVRTQQRSKMYGFTDKSTFSLQIQLFTKTYNRFPNAEFLRGQRVSVEQGSYQHRMLENFKGFNIKTFKDKVSPIRALYNDEVAAYCGPVPIGYYYMNKLEYTGITTMGTPLGIVEMRLAVARDRGDILKMANEGLAAIIASGEYDRIYRKWFVSDLKADESAALHKAALDASRSAYAPYAKQLQGAAVLTATGKVFSGCTVENADKRLSVSAVTAAVSRTITEGEMEIRAVVCLDQKGGIIPLTPQELQTIYEFGRGILVLGTSADGKPESRMVGELLPNAVMGKTAVVEVE